MNAGSDARSDDESAFHAIADRTLATLLERIEEVLGEDLDVDLQGGILSIELTSGGAYASARRFRRTDYRLVEDRFVVVSRTATAKPSLDAGVRPFTGCVVARGRGL